MAFRILLETMGIDIPWETLTDTLRKSYQSLRADTAATLRTRPEFEEE